MCTHHLRGAFRGLYLRYFFRHSILSKQRVQRPTFGNAMIFADFLLFLLCLNANEFLCFGAVFLRSPFRKLMVPKWYYHCRQSHTMQRLTLNPPQNVRTGSITPVLGPIPHVLCHSASPPAAVPPNLLRHGSFISSPKNNLQNLDRKMLLVGLADSPQHTQREAHLCRRL